MCHDALSGRRAIPVLVLVRTKHAREKSSGSFTAPCVANPLIAGPVCLLSCVCVLDGGWLDEIYPRNDER